jgi:hypothetical protein
MINRDLPVYILSSVTGLKRWVDYIPVKSGAYSGRDDSFDEEGCLTPAALSSTTGLTAWVDYVPVFEVSDADEFRWSFDDRGFYPVEYSSGGEVAFTPADLFASSEVGVWYDPSDYDTMYQESTGRTPVTAVEQTVGLILDMAQGAVRGAELVTNGDFSSGETGWTFNNFSGAPDEYHEVVGGRLHVVVTNTTGCSSGQAILTVGKWYEIIVTGEKISGDNISFRLGNTNTGSVISTGAFTYRALAQCTTNTSFTLQNNSNLNTEFYISTVSIKEVPGNHAYQATTASKPTLRARYNKLTYSEDFSNAAWASTGVTKTATAITATVTTNTHLCTQNMTIVSGTQYAFRVKLTYINHQYVGIRIFDSVTFPYVIFDLINGVIMSTGVGISGTITALGGGEFLCTAERTAGASGLGNFGVNLINPATPTAAGNWLATGTESVGVSEADVRTGASIATYQYIAAATVYDTVGFLPYLAFDGVDDVLATAAIAFTATNKLSAFAGYGLTSIASGYDVLFEQGGAAYTDLGTVSAFLNFGGTNKLTASMGTGGATAFAATDQLRHEPTLVHHRQRACSTARN